MNGLIALADGQSRRGLGEQASPAWRYRSSRRRIPFRGQPAPNFNSCPIAATDRRSSGRADRFHDRAVVNFKALLGAGSVKPFAVGDRQPAAIVAGHSDGGRLAGLLCLAVVPGYGYQRHAEEHHRQIERHHGAGTRRSFRETRRPWELGIEITPLTDVAGSCCLRSRGPRRNGGGRSSRRQPQGGIGAPRDWRIRALSLARRVPPMKVPAPFRRLRPDQTTSRSRTRPRPVRGGFDVSPIRTGPTGYAPMHG